MDIDKLLNRPRKRSSLNAEDPEESPSSHKAAKVDDGQASRSTSSEQPTSNAGLVTTDTDSRNASVTSYTAGSQLDRLVQKPKLKLIEVEGDLFSVPANSLLIHACNTHGHWGKGIAASFRQRYPEAYKAYSSHCDQPPEIKIAGQALLILPAEADDKAVHFIGCVFTSEGIGRAKDPKNKILSNTASAIREMLDLVQAYNEREGDPRIGNMFMCPINSGLFKVPWNETRRLLESIEVARETTITVMELLKP